jgi:hypothetical protein
MDMTGSCSEEDHSGNSRLDCGYIFHCPFISDTIMPPPSILSMNGWLRLMPTAGKIEEFPRLIFHPPEASLKI